MKHILLLVGGPSAERDVSLSSARDIKLTLEKIGHHVTMIDPSSESLLESLNMFKPHLVYNAMHGTYGEDGLVQSILELANIPYTHSGVLASAIAMNKTVTKKLMSACGINVAQSIEMNSDKCFKMIEIGEKLPIDGSCVIKPIAQGSTIGVFLMRNEKDRETLLREFKKCDFGENLLIEQYIKGKDLTVAVLRGNALGILELIPAENDLLDYNAKYISKKTQYMIPADIPPEICENAMRNAEKAHNELMCKTVSRADFRFDEEGYKTGKNSGLYFLEINTHPGMLLGHSFFPRIAEKAGISFEDLLKYIVEDASCEYTNRINLTKI